MALTPTAKPWISTPLVESAPLSKIAGCKVFLKLENLQPSGSFKLRGIGNYMLARLAELQQSNPDAASNLHFYSSSGGNAGLAAVNAARYLGFPCTVVVPLSTKPNMIERLRATGASDVIQHGPSWRDADAYLRNDILKDRPERVYVPPFDHKDIWSGNATMAHEMKGQLRDLSSRGSGRDSFQADGEASKMSDRPAAVICSVGGGGLANGVVQGLQPSGMGPTDCPSRIDWSSVPLIAVETQGAASLAASVKQGELVTLPAITSLATSLGATRVSERTFELAMKGREDGTMKSIVVSDEDAMEGSLALADEERLMVELSCGASAAPLFHGRLEEALGRKVQPHEGVVVIVCGGCNISPAMLEEYRTRLQGLPNGH